MSPGQPPRQSGKSNLKESSRRPKKVHISGFDHRVPAGSCGLHYAELINSIKKNYIAHFIKLMGFIIENCWGNGVDDIK